MLRSLLISNTVLYMGISRFHSLNKNNNLRNIYKHRKALRNYHMATNWDTTPSECWSVRCAKHSVGLFVWCAVLTNSGLLFLKNFFNVSLLFPTICLSCSTARATSLESPINSPLLTKNIAN